MAQLGLAFSATFLGLFSGNLGRFPGQGLEHQNKYWKRDT